MLKKLETDPEEVANPEERKRYIDFLEVHKDDPDA